MGMYQQEQGREFCMDCLPGFVTDTRGNDQRCQSCPIGRYQSEQGQKECTRASLDAVVLEGIVEVKVPQGSYKICKDDVCNQFNTCPSGWHGFDPPTAS